MIATAKKIKVQLTDKRSAYYGPDRVKRVPGDVFDVLPKHFDPTFMTKIERPPPKPEPTEEPLEETPAETPEKTPSEAAASTENGKPKETKKK